MPVVVALAPGAGSPPVTPIPPAPATVKIVDRAGAVIRTLVEANAYGDVEDLDPLQDAIRWDFPKKDPPGAGAGQGAAVEILKREVQVWDGATLLGWGVILEGETDSKSGKVDMTSPGLAWYLSRRYIDRPRVNYVVNPSFESDLTGWTAFGGAVPTIVTTPRRLGAKALKLVNTVTGADAGIRTTFSITGLPGIGVNVYVATHYLLETFLGEAIGNLSLRLVAREAGVEKGRTEQILGDGNELASIDGWLREEPPGPLWVPPGVTYDFTLDLMAPNGTIYFDANQAVIPESLSDYDVDLATVVGLITVDVQNATHKSNLNIATATPAVGVTIPVYAKQYTEHTPALVALNEISERDDGPDWWIDYTATTRTMRTSFPRRGTDRTGAGGVTLTYPGNVASYDPYRKTGSTVENHITYYGEGDGPDREEGYAIDTAPMGGLVLQGVYQAGPGTTVDMLEPLARGRLAAKKNLGQFVTVRTKPDATLFGLLRAGDRVNLVINDGWAQASGPWRITRRERFYRSKTMLLTMTKD